MAKQRVGIVFGGQSAEHEVSLQSAKNIINAIDKNRFEVVLIGINKQGQWNIKDINHYLLNENDPEYITLTPSDISLATIPGKLHRQLIDASNGQPLAQIDVVFPIVHGTLGEDGSLQGMLRMMNLPFVGSDVLSSAACMDKDITKRLLRDAGFHIAPFIILTRINRDSFTFAQIHAQLGLPLFVKPANQGSSIGISKVTNEIQFAQAVCLAFEFDHKVVIEQKITGSEIECAVLGNDFPQASTCGEVMPTNNFYSYNTKYMNNKAAQVVPAALAPQINDKIRTVAIEAYKTLGCTGMARVDVFLTPDNNVIINEINTLPGFTNNSMYPKLWHVSGLDCQDLITRLIELAIERYTANSILKSSTSSHFISASSSH